MLTNYLQTATPTKDIISLKNKEVRQKINGDDIIKMYIDSLKTDSTKRAFARSIYGFYSFLYGNTPISLDMMIVDPIHAQKYSNFCYKQYENGDISSSYYNHKIKGVKYFYSWLIYQTKSNILEYKLFVVNPFEKVTQIGENDSEGAEPLTPDDILTMLNNPYGSTPHIRERNMLMLLLAITTGIRNTALITITEDNIYRHGDDWVVEAIDKENKLAKMAINNYYERLMNWYRVDKVLRRKKTNLIFNITPTHANRIFKEWIDILKIAKGRKLTFHSLRTTTAMEVYKETGDIYRVQKALHHSDAKTSDLYISKAKSVNHDAEDIVENIKGTADKFADTIKGLDTDTMLKLFESLPMHEKMKIMRGLSK